MADEQKPKLENLAPNWETSQELTEAEAEEAQGGSGTEFLTFKFGTVFTTKIDSKAVGDDSP